MAQVQGTEAEGAAQREQAEKAPSASNITVSRWKKVDGDEGQLQILVEQLSRMEVQLATMQQALDRKDEMIQSPFMKISAREAQPAGVQLSSAGSESPPFDEEAYEDGYLGQSDQQQQRPQQQQQQQQQRQRQQRQPTAETTGERAREPEGWAKRGRAEDAEEDESSKKRADPFQNERYDPWGGEARRPERYRPRAQEAQEEDGRKERRSRDAARPEDRGRSGRDRADDVPRSRGGARVFSDDEHMPNFGNSNSGYGSGKERSRRPKALNYRLMKAPDVYGGNPIHYQEWRGDFRGYVASQDDNDPWVKILDDIEARGKKVVSKELTKNYFYGMGYDEEDTWVVITDLYNHLVKHTSGTAQGKVKLGGHKAVP